MCSNGDKAFYSIADNRGGGGFWQLLREATPAAPLPPKPCPANPNPAQAPLSPAF